MKPAISYYRVSTREQGDSGLGLEAQQAAVRAYARSAGVRIVDRFTEVESGKKSARPQLAAAIEECRRQKAVLIVGKLDRLSRNVAFTSALMDSGIEFVACDNPHATRLTLHILAAVAEDEARRISERTKAALAALKKRGVKLGNPNPIKAARKARAANSKSAQLWAAPLALLASKKRAAGRTLQEVADYLNGRNLLTRRGGKWNPTTVSRLLATSVPS